MLGALETRLLSLFPQLFFFEWQPSLPRERRAGARFRVAPVCACKGKHWRLQSWSHKPTTTCDLRFALLMLTCVPMLPCFTYAKGMRRVVLSARAAAMGSRHAWTMRMRRHWWAAIVAMDAVLLRVALGRQI